MFSLSVITQSISEIPAGVFSDKIGRVKTIRLAAFLHLVSYMLTALAGTFGSISLLIVASLVLGVGLAFASGTWESLIYETMQDARKSDKYDVAYSRIRAFGQLGSMIGAGIAMLVAFVFSLNVLAWVTVGICVIMLIPTMFLLEPSVIQKEQAPTIKHFVTAICNIWGNKKLRRLAAIKVLGGSDTYNLEGAYFNTLIPTYLVPVARLLRQFTGFIGFLIVPYIRKWGLFKVLLMSNIGSFVAKALGIGLNNTFSPFIISSTNFFYGIDTTASSALAQKEFSAQQRATMGSIISMGASVMDGLLLFCYGLIGDVFSIQAAIAAPLVINAVIIVGYYKMSKMYK
jgi:MFS family permease